MLPQHCSSCWGLAISLSSSDAITSLSPTQKIESVELDEPAENNFICFQISPAIACRMIDTYTTAHAVRV